MPLPRDRQSGRLLMEMFGKVVKATTWTFGPNAFPPAQTFLDGVTTAGSATFQSASAKFSALDVGKTAPAPSQFAAGTTISAVTNTTTVTMSSNASSTATGVPFQITSRAYFPGLSYPSGTPSLSLYSATRGYLQLATGAANGNSAEVDTFTFDTSTLKAVLFEVEGLVFNSSASLRPSLFIADTSASKGAYINQDVTAPPGDAQTHLHSYGTPAVDRDIEYNWIGGGNGTQRHNIGLLVQRAVPEVFVLEGDQVVAYQDLGGGSWVDGLIFAGIKVTTLENVAKNFQVSQMRLTVAHT